MKNKSHYIPQFSSKILCVSLRLNITLLALLLTFAFAHDAFANYQFDSWTTENGLPQNSINDVLQTRDGYLWLATNGGLARFDGVRFVVFDRTVEGIKSQRIKAVYEDSKGTLWAGTEEGMLIRYRDGKFTTFSPEGRLNGEELFMIQGDDEDNLWITGRSVFVKFDGERFINFQNENFTPLLSSPPGERKVSWRQDSAGLHCLVKGREQTFPLPDDLSKTLITGVSADFQGNLWVQTEGAGVLKAANGQFKRYTVREGLPDNDVKGIFLEDRKGNLWLANYKGGLYRIRDGTFETTLDFPLNSHIILYEDREGAIWFGTATGLYRMRESVITRYTEREGLSWNWTYSIFQDSTGANWIGTWGGGLNKFENGHFTRYGKADGLPSTEITCIYEDGSGKIWIGTTHGIGYFENGRFKIYEDPHGFLKPKTQTSNDKRDVWAMREDRDGNFWFGTDEGLVKLKDGNFTEYTVKDGLPHNIIRSLFEDRTGTLWIGTDQGLARLKDGVFTAYAEREGFIGNQVRAIYEDGDGAMWFGTYDGGLYRFKDERLTRYTTKEGLHDNGVFGILEDDAGNLWMSSNRGIYRVSRRELNDFAEGKTRSIISIVYGTKDGLATLECNGGRQPSALKTKDGKLWFPMMRGVAVIDPKALQINTQPPPVIIEEFRSGDETIDFPDSVAIPPEKDSFEIRYTAPSFVKSEYIKFKYKLEGLDKDWVDTGTRRVVNYNYVPPGEYTFTVIAANSDGVWNQTGKSIHIKVIPHWWEIWWVWALIGFVALLVLAFIVRFIYKRRTTQLKKEKAMQETLTEQYKKEKTLKEEFSKRLIESQEAERKRIAGELHDDLGHNLLMINNRVQVLLSKAKTDDVVRKTLADISETAVQSLDEVRRISHNLRPHLIDSLGLTQAINAMLNNVADSSGICLVCEVEPIDNLFPEEEEINVYRIVQESLNNIVKHSGATEVRVTIKKSPHTVLIEIEDNGCGFDSQADGAADLGLTNITERARILGGTHHIDSVPGRGTKVTAKLNLQGERNE